MADVKKKEGSGVPIGLPIAGVICLILGFIAQQIIPNTLTEEQLADNVILSAIPFILIFAAIIIAFMSLVWYSSSRLSNNISEKVYRPIEYLLIGGIVLGVALMFQPWVFILYRIGFFMLLIATLGYILWSHIRPKGVSQPEDFTGPTELN
jgi:uncharacterized membrane protein